MEKKKKKRKRKRSGLKIVCAILAIIIAFAGGGLYAFKKLYDKMVITPVSKDELTDIPNYDRYQIDKDINQNIAIFGVDEEEARTDVIFVMHINSETKDIQLVAVPRDTKVYWSDYQNEKMQQLGKDTYEYTKITDMSFYGGIDNLRYFTINSIEDIMGIKIDHYVIINTSAFRKIVDAIGGVDINVPRRMEYDDNWQGLHIDLQPGMQHLDGADAEGLVRWRHNGDYSEQYAEGDIGRIETQQLFLKALADKVLSGSGAIDLVKIATSVYDDIKTDVQFNELCGYLGLVTKFNTSNIGFHTLPGESVHEDRWYYVYEQDAVDEFMQEILGLKPKIENEVSNEEDSLNTDDSDNDDSDNNEEDNYEEESDEY